MNEKSAMIFLRKFQQLKSHCNNWNATILESNNELMETVKLTDELPGTGAGAGTGLLAQRPRRPLCQLTGHVTVYVTALHRDRQGRLGGQAEPQLNPPVRALFTAPQIYTRTHLSSFCIYAFRQYYQ